MASLDIYENNKYKRYNSACWVFRFNLPSFPRRWHHYPEIVYSQQDNALFEVNGQTYQVNTGDFLFIWPGEPHAFLKIPEKEKLLVFQFEASLLVDRTDFQRHALSFFYPIRHLRAGEHGPLVEWLSAQVLAIEQLKMREDPLLEMRSCMLVYAFFIGLWEGLQHAPQGVPAREDGRKTTPQRRIADVCAYITDHCAERITLENMAQKAGLSKCYFSKMFKEYTGQTFPSFLTSERLHIAERLLCDESLSITDVAYGSGFNSMATFNRVFFKWKGVNPTAFRKLYTPQPRG